MGITRPLVLGNVWSVSYEVSFHWITPVGLDNLGLHKWRALFIQTRFLFISIRDFKYARLIKWFACNLHTDRKPICSESAWYGYGG